MTFRRPMARQIQILLPFSPLTPKTHHVSPIPFRICSYNHRARNQFRFCNFQTLVESTFCKLRAICTLQSLGKEGGGGVVSRNSNSPKNAGSASPYVCHTSETGPSKSFIGN